MTSITFNLLLGVLDPESLANLLKRPWDPLGGLFALHRLRKIPANPIILTAPDVPSSFASAHSSKRKKFWQNQLSSLGKIIPISSGVHSSGISAGGANSGAIAQQSLENMINAMRAKVNVTSNCRRNGGPSKFHSFVPSFLYFMNTFALIQVCDLREHYSPQERPIVLLGWGVGALVCVHVALVEQVSAVVCLGFPFLGIG